MAEPVHIQAVEHALSAIYASGDTLLSSFIINKPNAPVWDRLSGIGTEIFVRERDYTKALIFIRQNGASYLRSMSLGDLRSLVTKFLTENFWYIKTVSCRVGMIARMPFRLISLAKRPSLTR